MAGNFDDLDDEPTSTTSSPIRLASHTPWQTNSECVNTLNNEDKTEAMEQHCAKQRFRSKDPAESFLKVIFDPTFRVYTRQRRGPFPGLVSEGLQCGTWCLGKPVFDTYRKVHSSFVEVMNLRRSPGDPPLSSEFNYTLAGKIDDAAANYYKRIGRPFILGTVLLWYNELASGSSSRDVVLADGLALLLFDYDQKMFVLAEDYPLDDDGYPLLMQESRDYVVKWLPKVALRWMETGHKAGSGKAPNVPASTLPDSFVFWQPRPEWKENPSTGQEDRYRSPLGKYMHGYHWFSRRFQKDMAGATTKARLRIENYIQGHREELQMRLEEQNLPEWDTDEEAVGE